MPALPPLLSLKDVRLRRGATAVLDGAELAVAPGERIALVGRNGSGKSTLLQILAGTLEADSGERFAQPGATVRYLPQEPDLSGFATTLAYVEAGLGPGDDPYRAHYLLEMLGLTGTEDPRALSGGEQRRAALARVLAPEPDVLLLDEPTNHLDLPAIERLESDLAAGRSALVVVSHDRRFLENLSRSTVWLDRGATRRLERGFDAFEAWRDEVLELEERERHKLDRKIVAELDWLRYGVSARRKRNVRRLGQLHALRRSAKEARKVQGDVTLTVTEAETSGKVVIEAKGLVKRFGARTVVDGVTLTLARGDRLGLVGPNGAGKTTLVKLLLGEIAPDAGTVKLGTNLSIATIDQRRETLDGAQTVADVLTGGRSDQVMVGNEPRHVVSYMKDFLFLPEQARAPVSALSGGERARLLLARALARPANLLVLDEPTNDLDLETLDLLEERLADHPATVLFVSHDRDFLDRVATAVLASDGDGRWTEYAGGYADMVAQKGSGVAARVAARPAEKAPKDVAAKAPPKPAASERKRLSFKDKHALETLPARIAALGEEARKLEARLADPALAAKGRAALEAVGRDLATVQAAMAAAEDEWLRLEMLREEVEGG